MTDKEKLTEAACNQCGELVGIHGDITMSHVLKAFKMGAGWKDQQFKECLEKKRNEFNSCKHHSIGLFPNDVIRYNGAIEVINEIIDELFGETEQDNSDREE